jgi:Tfp pilus assembly protein PilF
VSLFSDALREAERERSHRATPDASAPPVENALPQSDEHVDGAAPSARISAGAATLVVLLVIGWGVHTGAYRASAAKPVPLPHDSVVTIASVESTPVLTTVPSVDSTRVPAEPKAAPAPPALPAPAQLARPTIARRDSVVPAPITMTTPVVALQAVARESPASQPSTAVADSEARLAIEPSARVIADSLFRIAFAEQMKNNLDGAQSLYEKAIATTRAPAEAYNNYGVLLLSRGNKTTAAEMFRQALNRDDKNVEAWVNLGDSFNGMGQAAAAMAAYARANQLDASRTAVKSRIAREYEALGDTASARRYLEDAIKASPNDAAAHYSLGTYLQRAQDYRGAIRELQAFVDLSAPENDSDFVSEVRRHIDLLKQVAP